MELTFYEVNWRLQAIKERRDIDIETQAKLHGMEIKGAKKSETPNVTEDAKKVFDKLLEDKENGRQYTGKSWLRY